MSSAWPVIDDEQERRLDRVLTAFVDAVMEGRLDDARRLFGDAQALGLAAVRTPAELWAEVEHRSVAYRLPDHLGDVEGEAALRRILRGVES